MLPTEVDIESLSKKATFRWKRSSLASTDRSISKTENKRLHSMIVKTDPKNFLSVSLTTADDSIKVSKHEDLKEISLQLSILKKKHDLNRDSNFLHDTVINRLKKQLDSFQQEEDKTLSKIDTLKAEANRLEDSIKEITQKQEDSLAATKIYNHIIERMKITKQKLDLQNEKIIKSVKGNKKMLLEEVEICRKKKEVKIKTKKALDLLEDFIEQETKERQERLEVIEKDVKRKQEFNQKREERFRRQLEIAETAANEDREMRATQMRESVMMHKFWYLYMKKRLEYDMEKLNPIEKAFEKVRKNSSINDASEMVTKFLTTEIAYNELKRIVDDSNLNISKTHQRIAEIEENLEKAENLKPQSELKDALQKDIINKLKTVSDDKNNLMKFKQIHEKITNWSWKMLRRLGNNEKSQNLIENLKLIKNSVSEVQKRIKENVMDI